MSEKIADIVAQMRGRGEDGRMDMLLWRQYADRIEAAAKRERAEIEANALACGGIVEASRHTPGNTAAMREALIWMKERIIAAIHDGSLDCSEVLNKIEDALKKPARNCDIYATATKALKAQDVAFNEDNFKNGECKLGCPGCDDALIDCKILWLFAKARERKGPGK